MFRIILLSYLVLVITDGYSQSGISFSEITTGANAIHMTNARAVVVADYDNDGDDDFYVTGKPSRLYRNDGDMKFLDVTREAGLDNVHSYSALWVDIDNDGDLDLFHSSDTRSDIFLNNGDGTFSAKSGPGIWRRQMLMAGDVNRDGWPDIFATGLSVRHQLLMNAGNGLLIDEAESRGVSSVRIGMGGVMIDHDLDGDLDLYLVYDGYKKSELFLNDGSGRFEESADEAGLDIETQAMGVDSEDINGDGRPDYYVTNLYENYLLISQPDGTYLESGHEAGVDDYGMGWGTRMFDVNNDGFTDIFVHNAFDFSPYPNRLFINDGENSFVDIAPGNSIENRLSGYGMATADLDNDGLTDIILVNTDAANSVRIFRNESENHGHWLQLDLIGTSVNSFGIGTKLKIYSGDQTWTRQVLAGSGWMGQHSYRQSFGLGDHQSVDSIEVEWTDGTHEVIRNVSSDRRYLIVQGIGLKDYTPENFQENIITSQLPENPSVRLPDLPDPGYSIARQWNEALLLAIRNDLARPTVHARNLYHISAAMYDAWAAYGANTYLFGKEKFGFKSTGVPIDLPENIEESRSEAIAFAAFRMLEHRFRNSPGRGISMAYFRSLMERQGYDPDYTAVDYLNGKPADLGNFIAAEYLSFGDQDGSNEANNYANLYYEPVNLPLFPFEPGNPTISDPNRWQPLRLISFIDQSGNQDGDSPPFLGPEWGNVWPFAMNPDEAQRKIRDGHEYLIYHDPGIPAQITDAGGLEDPYKWNHTMVSVWGSHLDPGDGVMMDISPASLGNNTSYPDDPVEYPQFYRFLEGGDISTGYPVNPVTGEVYAPNVVPRGDFARVLAEFWADGPDSETPPGHWFTLLNYVNDHPMFQRKWLGTGEEMDQLEWDVKAYLTMGGAMHDAAVTAWGIKGYYDYIRPISAIRYMADRGQSSDPDLPSFHPHGLPLIPGFIELIDQSDELAGEQGEHIGKIKVYTWRGHSSISNPETDMAGVGWIRAEDWFSYQRPTFVTPPFAGYISGHSTFSSAGAEVLSLITGSEYFPGGLGTFVARKNEFLVFEEGPSTDITLQWARYRDASDQSSMSRIWGGIHPPVDDIPGRKIGITIGKDAVNFVTSIFENTVVTGKETLFSDDFNIFPNPVGMNQPILFTTGMTGRFEVRVFDVFGRMLRHYSQEGSSSGQIQFEANVPGMYIVEIGNGERRFVRRLVIRD